jgi:D-galactose 1-dehydrogenase
VHAAQGRHRLARYALEQGKHVMLEKPPGATLSEVEDLHRLADAQKLTLFATWHSRFGAAVEPARAWLANRTMQRVQIDWREDVRHWHPGQDWIWEPGGLGVFDPGVNALSIATRLLPEPFFLAAGELRFPENRATPIAAELDFRSSRGAPIHASFDWLQTGEQTWTIRVETAEGLLMLTQGGAAWSLDGQPQALEAQHEYPALYARFAELIREGRSDVDLAPFATWPTPS